MDTRSAHGALQHFGIHHGVSHPLIGRSFGLAKLRNAFDGIRNVHLQTIGQFIGDEFAEGIHLVERHFFHTRHVLNRVFGGHRTIGNDMCHLVVSVFIFHPFEHASSSVVVEVGVDIGQ